jgi:hypothetical protein
VVNFQVMVLEVLNLGPTTTGMVSGLLPIVDKYNCSKMRDRIHEWLSVRRFGDPDPERLEGTDLMASMNGIEISQYKIPTLLVVMTHHFAGIHLSGSSDMDDPRFLDPWWRQDWSLPEYLTPEGLYTKGWERLNSLSLLVAGIPLGLLVVKGLALLGGVAILALRDFILAWIGANLGTISPANVWVSSDDLEKPGGLYTRFNAKWHEGALQHLKSSHPTGVPTVTPVCPW